MKSMQYILLFLLMVLSVLGFYNLHYNNAFSFPGFILLLGYVFGLLLIVLLGKRVGTKVVVAVVSIVMLLHVWALESCYRSWTLGFVALFAAFAFFLSMLGRSRRVVREPHVTIVENVEYKPARRVAQKTRTKKVAKKTAKKSTRKTKRKTKTASKTSKKTTKSRQ